MRAEMPEPGTAITQTWLRWLRGGCVWGSGFAMYLESLFCMYSEM